MSAVLKKKVSLATGVPPTIREGKAFWSVVTGAIEEWLLESVKIEGVAAIEKYRVLTGRSALEYVSAKQPFFFSKKASEGLAAFIVDDHIMAANAASRMKSTVESFHGTPPVFLKLLFEPQAQNFLSMLNKALIPVRAGTKPPKLENAIGDAVHAVGGFAPTHRYVDVTIKCDLMGRPAKLHLMFDLAYAVNACRNHGGRARTGGKQRPPASVLQSKITVDAVLDRLQISIGDCSRLDVGDVVPLGSADISKLKLSTQTIDGHFDIGDGTLGSFRSHRAIKLTRTSDTMITGIGASS